jgi:hypothetical protein
LHIQGDEENLKHRDQLGEAGVNEDNIKNGPK